MFAVTLKFTVLPVHIELLAVGWMEMVGLAYTVTSALFDVAEQALIPLLTTTE